MEKGTRKLQMKEIVIIVALALYVFLGSNSKHLHVFVELGLMGAMLGARAKLILGPLN